MIHRWHKIESGQITHIQTQDFWMYARKYIPDTGYQAGETNSLILNFKKPPCKKKEASRMEIS